VGEDKTEDVTPPPPSSSGLMLLIRSLSGGGSSKEQPRKEVAVAPEPDTTPALSAMQRGPTRSFMVSEGARGKGARVPAAWLSIGQLSVFNICLCVCVCV
jgi:hypothetical protein